MSNHETWGREDFVPTDEADRLHKINADLLAALKAFLDVAKESHGVDGYHLNGNIATWDELGLIDPACIAIAKAETGHE